MEDRLSQLCFLPPPVSTAWSGHECDIQPKRIRRRDGEIVPMDLPLFWYNPPWNALSYQQADWLATAVAGFDVMTSALRRDLSEHEASTFHSPVPPPEQEGDENEQDKSPPVYLPRIVPYRPERYGLLPEDFDDARLIDVRLTLHRDYSGRYAFSPDQIQRWEATPEDSPHAGGGYVPAGTFPPDVVSLKQLGNKLDQLRKLSPGAAVFVSILPYRLEEELSGVMAAKPDGVILQMDQSRLEPLQLAGLTRTARRLMKAAQSPRPPLWVVPGPITPDDAAKLIALGASAVAIDDWCDPLVDGVLNNGGQGTYSAFGYNDVLRLVHAELSHRIDRVAGLVSSIARIPRSERLGTFSATWAKTLNIPALR